MYVTDDKRQTDHTMEIGVTTNEIVALEQFGLILDKYGIHV